MNKSHFCLILDIDLQQETQDANAFITESTLGAIKDCCSDTVIKDSQHEQTEIGPNLITFGIESSKAISTQENPLEELEDEITLDGLDEDEIDSYLMTPEEAQYKDGIWTKINATYLEDQRSKHFFF